MLAAEPSPPTPTNGPNLPLSAHIEVASATWGQSTLNPLTLGLQQLPNASWKLHFGSPLANGHILLNRPEGLNQLHFTQLHLPEDTAETYNEGKCTPFTTSGDAVLPPSQLTDFNPSLIPPLEVTLDAIYKGKAHLGQVRFITQPIAQGVRLEQLEGKVYGLKLEGFNRSHAHLDWTRQDQRHHTQFSGRLTTSNLNDALHALGEPEAISSETATFNLQLDWPGAPDQMGLANVTGFTSFNITKGRFAKGGAAGSSPLLKLISFLNFDNLARRLRFDFADLNPQGMAFDTLEGRLDYQAGQLLLKNPIQLHSASTHIQLAGQADVASQQVNGQLVATLPLTGNITLAVAMTGALPLAAGVYLASKVFKKQLDKASSLRYKVTGPWQDPALNLQSIFDNETQQEVKAKPTPKKLKSNKN